MLSIRRGAVPARYIHEKFGFQDKFKTNSEKFKTNVIGRRESPHSVLGLAEGATTAEIKATRVHSMVFVSRPFRMFFLAG